MRRHPYLRAYMAGVLLPSWILLLILGAVVFGQLTRHLPAGAEGAPIFPMAVVPNLWGLWNMLYIRLRLQGRVSIGLFGAVLPLILVPAGVALATALGVHSYNLGRVAIVIPVVVAIYYLLWKYGVAFLNRVVEVS